MKEDDKGQVITNTTEAKIKNSTRQKYKISGDRLLAVDLSRLYDVKDCDNINSTIAPKSTPKCQDKETKYPDIPN